MALSERRIRFVQYIVAGDPAGKAAERAGYSKETAYSYGPQLLQNLEIQAAIVERRAEVAANEGLDRNWVLSHWRKIADADPNELMQIQRICCRFCHGAEHRYQWTQAQYMATVNAALSQIPPIEPPDGLGGFGYDAKADPHPKCPECHGDGLEEIFFADTRKLSPGAKRLYAGVQKTKDGMKLLTRDQDAAVLNIAKYIGMLIERKEVSGPDGKPVSLAVSVDDFTDEQLLAMLSSKKSSDS